jgi:hypothetical protein
MKGADFLRYVNVVKAVHDRNCECRAQGQSAERWDAPNPMFTFDEHSASTDSSEVKTAVEIDGTVHDRCDEPFGNAKVRFGVQARLQTEGVFARR